MALTDASFGDEMRSALDEGEGIVPVVTDGEGEDEDYDNMLLAEVDSSSFVDVPAGAGAFLVLPPVPTRSASSQMGSQEVDVNERIDDRDLETQGSILSSLTSKTQKVKEMKREYAHMLRSQNEASPFDLLASRRAEIDSLADDEVKQENIAFYIAVSTIFEKCRHDVPTRDFVVDLFAKTQAYYEHKQQRKEARYQVSLTPTLPSTH